MRRANQTDGPGQTSSANDSSSIPFDGGYLTDGETLFHIERTLLDDPHGQLLVELEDCATLELIVCSARSVAELGLRPVQPRAQPVQTVS
jgi:hypothetical protein